MPSDGHLMASKSAPSTVREEAKRGAKAGGEAGGGGGGGGGGEKNLSSDASLVS